ncbi:MAG TPA: YbjQ family protein [Gemmataceae bacterium]|nr:YbjQ family protein [Gemmataceae bacterium]
MSTVDPRWVTTAFELPGRRITKNLGLVRGIVVRSRSIIGNIGAGLQTLFGGNITLYTELCERARGDAYRLMIEHAGDMGANAIIGMRYDANEVAAGVTEVLAYGTAVVTEPSDTAPVGEAALRTSSTAIAEKLS